MEGLTLEYGILILLAIISLVFILRPRKTTSKKIVTNIKEVVLFITDKEYITGRAYFELRNMTYGYLGSYEVQVVAHIPSGEVNLGTCSKAELNLHDRQLANIEVKMKGNKLIAEVPTDVQGTFVPFSQINT